MTSDTPRKYPLSICLLHWLVALAMISTLVIGWLLDDYEDLIGLHRSLGILVLMLVILRLGNRVLNTAELPSPVNSPGSMQYLAEKAVHGFLYLSMLAVPLLGWLKTNASGHPASFFGIFDLPQLLDKNADISHLLGEAHSLAATVFAVLLGLHVAGALAHWVLHKENILKRITP